MARTVFRAGEADFRLIWHGREVQAAVKDELLRALLNAGEIVRSQASGTAPVVTGTYKRSLSVGVRAQAYSDEATGKKAVDRQLAGDVKVAGDMLETHVGTFVRYAYRVEIRHGTLFGALLAKKDEVHRHMAGAIKALLR